jgi:hypothetical protein
MIRAVQTGQVERATARLLWAACRPEPDVDGIAGEVDRGADLDRAALVAVVQRVGPLLRQSLTKAGLVDDVGGEASALLRADADLRRFQAGLQLPVALRAAIEPLTAAGFEPLVFKGPALATRYPDPGLRPMDDIDVLLPPEQHQEAVAALLAAGWRTVERDRALYDTFLSHERAPDLPLELHQDLALWRERAARMGATDLWARRVPIDCLGVRAFGLPPEEELVALAAHAGKPYHHFHRMIWSVDLAVVVAAAGGALDWERVGALAERWGSRTVLGVGLVHATWLGADVDEALLRFPASRVRRAALDPVLSQEWPLGECHDGLHRRLRYALWDSPRQWAVLLAGEVTKYGLRSVPRQTALLSWGAMRRTWRILRAPAAR